MKKKKNVRGFTLIEVMIASTMFLVSLAGVLTAFHMSSGYLQHYERETTATHIAESLLEDLMLRQRGDAELVANTTGLTYTHTYDDEANVSATGKYTGAWTVTSDKPMAGLKTLTMKVSWAEDGVTRRVQMQTVRE